MAASSVNFTHNLFACRQPENVHGDTIMLTYSSNYKDRQVLQVVRAYVRAPILRAYIRHMPGCRSFFHSKGKAVSPPCYCRNKICFHPCLRMNIFLSNYHFMIKYVSTMPETRVLPRLAHWVAVMTSLLYHECQPSLAAPG